jgi:outer membrane protein assembly factor BamB
MNKLHCKTKLSTIALILVLTISAILVVLPAATAQEPPRQKTYAFVGAIPNPVGVNEQTLLHVGITQQCPSATDSFVGLSVSIEKPDGEVETITDITTDATGGTGVVYVPDQVGTYYIQTHFPEQVYPGRLKNVIEEGTIMEASVSEVGELIVTEEPNPSYPGFELPDEYWTRPIDAQMREWSVIAGSWLESWPYVPHDMSVRTADYNDGPETGHILWEKTLIAMGGLVGGDLGDLNFEHGDAYEGKWKPPLVIGGVLFYNQFQSGGGTNVEQIVVAVDLRTGEELWARPLIGPNGDNLYLDFGQLFYFDSYNYHGVFGYLWCPAGGYGQPTSWHAFDPSTGRWVYSMENVPSGKRVHGPKGELIIYSINQVEGWMTMWNSTRVVTGPTGYGSWLWGREGSVFNATNGIQWNVSIPEGLPSGADYGIRSVKFEDRIIFSGDQRWDQTPADFLHIAAVDLKPGHEGELIFNVTWIPPSPPLSAVVKFVSPDDGVIILGIKETRQIVGVSYDTGAQMWIGDPMNYLEIYTATNDRRSVAQVADGMIFTGGMSGTVYCHDAKNGTLLWTYDSVDPYNEILWGNHWPVYGAFVADGKLYLQSTEHSPFNPMPRGYPFTCLDIETGKEIWSINLRGHHWGGYPVIADSTIAIYNSYDQRIYALGKGPSETTVSIRDNVVQLGSSVLIDGTVMDISPGTEDIALGLRFPKGVPAVSDEDMSEWMEYVYLHHERPEDFEGVEVFLKIQDPNGDYYSATVTTDENGMFSFMWVPSIAGEYRVTAMFEGSKAFYASESTTTLGVDPALEEYPDVPTAEEIAVETAQRTINMLPAYPDVPTQEQVADDAATRTIAMLPAYPTLEMPAYLTIDIVILIVAAVGVVIGLIAFMAVRKQK